MRLRVVPDNTKIDFVAYRYIGFAITGLMMLAAVVSLSTQGLNLGIDFTGGVLIEATSISPVDMAGLRSKVEGLGLGQVTLQSIGGPNDVLIRVQPREGQSEQAAAEAIQQALGEGFTINRIETVGPKVSGELFRDGVIATVLAILMVSVYVAFRFEWQYGVASIVATLHDVLSALMLFSLFQLDFDLSSVAALLTLAGYSVNDTVVVFDRIRENRRKFKKMPLPDLINLSTNQTLARTFMTSFTTFIAILPVLLFGGPTLFTFALAITFGIFVGTYSSIYVAGSLLLYLPPLASEATAERAPAPAGSRVP